MVRQHLPPAPCSVSRPCRLHSSRPDLRIQRRQIGVLVMELPVVHAVRVITRSLAVRFHMTLILLVVFSAGVGSSYGLLRVWVCSMPGRYVFAVLLGYILFVLGVRLWLWYAQKTLPLQSRLRGDDRLADEPTRSTLWPWLPGPRRAPSRSPRY